MKNIIKTLKKILRFIKWFWWYFIYSTLVIIFGLVFIYFGLAPWWFIISILSMLMFGFYLVFINDDDYILFEIKIRNDEKEKEGK